MMLMLMPVSLLVISTMWYAVARELLVRRQRDLIARLHEEAESQRLRADMTLASVEDGGGPPIRLELYGCSSMFCRSMPADSKALAERLLREARR